jgi:signal transduction histidine kinase
VDAGVSAGRAVRESVAVTAAVAIVTMKTIRARLVVLVATAAIAPLIAYGLVSIGLLWSGTRQSVTAGALSVAEGAAEQINGYMQHNVDLLQAVSADLHHTLLERWQQERILRNYVLTFPDFRELTLFDPDGTPVVSSRLGRPELVLTLRPEPGAPLIAPIEIDDDLLPRTVITIRVDQAGRVVGYLVGELRLEELWRLVDRIRIGRHGFALVVDEQGRLLAHGNPDEKRKVSQGAHLNDHPLLKPGQNAARPASEEYDAGDDRRVLAVVQPIKDFKWRLVIEQPTAEAFGLARRLEGFLVLTISLALFSTIVIASFWGRSFLRPIGDLIRGTRALSEGRLQERVEIHGQDEFSQLGEAFNLMADRLATLQADAVKQERQATFGRIAAGLVHDLAHPIQNIGNNCKLMLKMYEDPEYRATFRRMVDREFSAIKRLLEDLRNLGRPIPLERFPVDVNRSLMEAAERMALLAEQSGVTLQVALGDDPIVIEGDLFALGRVYRNLLLNSVQATAPGGQITITSGTSAAGRVTIRVSDTGCGIAPERLSAIFDDYTTTKRRGLGLGLAISKKIVEQLHGSIDVESEVGRGTTFTLTFPALPTEAHARAAAAAVSA